MSQLHRRTIRLPHYDYTQPGAYFVTLCTWRREPLFGEVVGGEMRLNECGRIVTEEWQKSAQMRREIRLDAFVAMPNHIHGIVMINMDTAGDVSPAVGAHGRAPLHRPPRSLGSFVAGFKSAATTRINALRHTPGESAWQRNYYEHIIRNEVDLARIREYILNNPARWAADENNPAWQPGTVRS